MMAIIMAGGYKPTTQRLTPRNVPIAAKMIRTIIPIITYVITCAMLKLNQDLDLGHFEIRWSCRNCALSVGVFRHVVRIN